MEDTPQAATEEAPIDELADFARSFTEEEEAPEAEVVETPAAEEKNPAADEKGEKTPAAEEKEEKTPAAADDENPFDSADEKKAHDEEETPEKPTSSDDWNRLRESRNRHRATAEERENLLNEREAEVTELRAKAARAVELEDKLKVFEEQEKELAIARVESTREYKETIDAPLTAIKDQVEILVESNEGDMEPVYRMLREPDPAKQRTLLKEITSGWDEIDRLDLKKMSEDARTILDKQDAMRANAHAAAKERESLAGKAEAEAKELRIKEFSKATTAVVEELRGKVPFVPLMEGETEEDRYASLAQKVSKVDLTTQTPRAQALAVASTFALPQAIKTIAAKDKEIGELKAALAKSDSSRPSLNPRKAEVEEEGEKDFFVEFGIPDRSDMFGTM